MIRDESGLVFITSSHSYSNQSERGSRSSQPMREGQQQGNGEDCHKYSYLELVLMWSPALVLLQPQHEAINPAMLNTVQSETKGS